jgi:hypothetical protein
MKLNNLSAFLTGVRIPFLDSYLSLSLQSVLFEVLVWTVGYLVYAQTMQRLMRELFRSHRFWYTAHKRKGIFTHNAQDELPAFLVVGLQHIVGGILMTLGVVYEDHVLWRHGFLMEAGFEVADLISMAMKLAPYDFGVKEELFVPIICHHFPGMLVTAAILEAGLHENPHLRIIGMWCVERVFAVTRVF